MKDAPDVLNKLIKQKSSWQEMIEYYGEVESKKDWLF